MTRVERWREEFPLRPGPLTHEEAWLATRLLSEWVHGHPEHTAVGRWSEEERLHFNAVGRLVAEYYGELAEFDDVARRAEANP